jgi:hypothetical protein
MTDEKSDDQLLWEKFFPEEKWHVREEEEGKFYLNKKCSCGENYCWRVFYNPSPTTNAADYLRLMERVSEHERYPIFLYVMSGKYDLGGCSQIVKFILDPARGCAALVEYFCKEER